mmetsp:Transcript_35122/g.64141  ORF Transcript_35122/g.64141 Transcript_35122/m.64141 type:complete len:281 (-) Transcript_35122:100-942(-)
MQANASSSQGLYLLTGRRLEGMSINGQVLHRELSTFISLHLDLIGIVLVPLWHRNALHKQVLEIDGVSLAAHVQVLDVKGCEGLWPSQGLVLFPQLWNPAEDGLVAGLIVRVQCASSSKMAAGRHTETASAPMGCILSTATTNLPLPAAWCRFQVVQGQLECINIVKEVLLSTASGLTLFPIEDLGVRTAVETIVPDEPHLVLHPHACNTLPLGIVGCWARNWCTGSWRGRPRRATSEEGRGGTRECIPSHCLGPSTSYPSSSTSYSKQTNASSRSKCFG